MSIKQFQERMVERARIDDDAEHTGKGVVVHLTVPPHVFAPIARISRATGLRIHIVAKQYLEATADQLTAIAEQAEEVAPAARLKNPLKGVRADVPTRSLAKSYVAHKRKLRGAK